MQFYLLLCILFTNILLIHPSEKALLEKLKSKNIEIIYDVEKPISFKEKTDKILKNFKNHNLLLKNQNQNFPNFINSFKISFLFMKDYYFTTDDKIIKSNYFKIKMECVFDHFKIIMIRIMVLFKQLSRFDFKSWKIESLKIQNIFKDIGSC